MAIWKEKMIKFSNPMRITCLNNLTAKHLEKQRQLAKIQKIVLTSTVCLLRKVLSIQATTKLGKKRP